ncbi:MULTISPECIES: hypothetical protein [unclassified Roseitalea]|uniref:hypothetical protein n=1 Tax=unclassified Roseitalea TaxID=2639107 RepID=UPI00273F468D|nr:MULTISPECIES: hypothetical protein [unclassified Roseitalea]
MQIVTLSLFRFSSPTGRLWAFAQMGLMHPAIGRLEGLCFYKLLGTGAGAGFSLKPDFSTYALICVWQDMAAARRAVGQGEVHAAYRRHASQMATLYLTPTRSRGQWAGQAPFTVDPETVPRRPIVALTRATLRLKKLVPFWSQAPGISDEIETDPHQRFMMGLGEVPYKHMMTFSIWDDEAAMRAFSLDSASHGVAVRRAWQEGWFVEYLFARFNLIAIDGAWPGLEPFAQRAQETAPAGAREAA